MRVILQEVLKSSSPLFEVRDLNDNFSSISVNCTASPLVIFVVVATLTSRDNVKVKGIGVRDIAKGGSPFADFGLKMEMSPGIASSPFLKF